MGTRDPERPFGKGGPRIAPGRRRSGVRDTMFGGREALIEVNKAGPGRMTEVIRAGLENPQKALGFLELFAWVSNELDDLPDHRPSGRGRGGRRWQSRTFGSATSDEVLARDSCWIACSTSGAISSRSFCYTFCGMA